MILIALEQGGTCLVAEAEHGRNMILLFRNTKIMFRGVFRP